MAKVKLTSSDMQVREASHPRGVVGERQNNTDHETRLLARALAPLAHSPSTPAWFGGARGIAFELPTFDEAGVSVVRARDRGKGGTSEASVRGRARGTPPLAKQRHARSTRCTHTRKTQRTQNTLAFSLPPPPLLSPTPRQMFEVDEEVANESVTIKNMIEGESGALCRLDCACIF